MLFYSNLMFCPLKLSGEAEPLAISVYKNTLLSTDMMVNQPHFCF